MLPAKLAATPYIFTSTIYTFYLLFLWLRPHFLPARFLASFNISRCHIFVATTPWRHTSVSHMEFGSCFIFNLFTWIFRGYGAGAFDTSHLYGTKAGA